MMSVPRYYTLRALSWTIDYIVLFAVPVFAFHTTGEIAWSGLAVLAQWAPRVLSLIGAGALVDRWSPRVVLVVCDLIRGATALAAAVAIGFRTTEPMFAILVFALVVGLCFEQTYVAGERLSQTIARTERQVDTQSVLTALEQSSVLLGPLIHSVALSQLFKNKVLMKEKLRGRIRIPKFIRTSPESSAEAIIAAVGVPVVLKPTSSAGSHGVSIHTSAASLAEALTTTEPTDFECEEYVSDEILHIDGVVRKGRHLFCQVSAYVGNPLRFLVGEPVGSFTFDSPEARHLAQLAVDALGLIDGVYHLELMRADDGSLVFLEVGMRPGGSEIVDVARENHGVDLFEEAFRAALGIRSRLVTPATDQSSPVQTGWVIYPLPPGDKLSGLHAQSMRGIAATLYRETLCTAADVFSADSGYMGGPARYCFRAPDSQAIRRDIELVISSQPVTAPGQRPGTRRGH